MVFDEKYVENIEEIKRRNNTNLEDYICMTKKDGYKENAIERIINDDTIIPAVNAKQDDTEKTYE